MARLSEQQLQIAQTITAPEAFIKYFDKYFDSLFIKTGALKGRLTRRSEWEDFNQFILYEHQEWISLFLNVAAKYLQVFNNAELFAQGAHSFVTNPLMNAQMNYRMDLKRIIAEAKKSKQYIKMLIDKINQLGWNPETFQNAFWPLGIDPFRLEQAMTTEKTKGFLGLFKKTIQKPVQRWVPRTKEEILAELSALL